MLLKIHSFYTEDISVLSKHSISDGAKIHNKNAKWGTKAWWHMGMYNSTLTPRSKQKAIHMDFQLWNPAEIGFACQILSWSTTDCTLLKSFPSPGKLRLFFFLKWRKVPATPHPRTPTGLGVYLIIWAGFCSPHLPSSLAGTGCQFPRCCLRLSNAQIQSPCRITSGVEQKSQIIHFVLKLTLSSSCFPRMLYSGRAYMFCSIFSAVASA